jgi:hypothetical protein
LTLANRNRDFMVCKIDDNPRRRAHPGWARPNVSLTRSLWMGNVKLEKLFEKRLLSHSSIQQGETKRSRTS